MPAAVPQLTEAAALTQPVESLLLDELQNLRLNSLPQLAAAQTQHEQHTTTHTHINIDNTRLFTTMLLELSIDLSINSSVAMRTVKG